MEELPNYSKEIVLSILLQSVITGGLAGAVLLFLFALIGITRFILWGLFTLSGCTFIAWCILLRYAILERWEISGVIKEPELEHQAPEVTRVIVPNDQVGRDGSFALLPCSEIQFRSFVAGVVAGASLAINYWSSSGVFSRSEYERFRAALIERGLARMEGSNKGLVLTRGGEAALKYYSQEFVCGAVCVEEHTPAYNNLLASPRLSRGEEVSCG